MTKLFGVVGYPVGHSLSPVIFEAAFAAAGVDAKYQKFEVKPEDLKVFLQRVKSENFSGLSITIPHKQAIIHLLDEVDSSAEIIGAVNTVKNENGKLKGYNTDFKGALNALEEASGFLQDKNVTILGAGGAAAAIIYACVEAGANVTIFNRTPEKALALAEKFKVKALPFEQIYDHPADIIIQTTSVGMLPNSDQSPISAEYFKKNMVAMDIVYNPLQTKFLRDAEAVGCTLIPGYQMLLNQAVLQFKIWFGQQPDKKKMKEILLEKLGTF